MGQQAQDAAGGVGQGGGQRDRLVTGKWKGWTGSCLLHDRYEEEGGRGQLSTVNAKSGNLRRGWTRLFMAQFLQERSE